MYKQYSNIEWGYVQARPYYAIHISYWYRNNIRMLSRMRYHVMGTDFVISSITFRTQVLHTLLHTTLRSGADFLHILINLLAFYFMHAIMGPTASQITSLTIVYLIIHSGADQRKQSSKVLAFVCGIHRWPVNSRAKGQERGKCFHLMTSSYCVIKSVSW